MSKYFKPEEFMCHCGCGEKDVNPKLVELLDRIRVSFGKPITIMSGKRCEAHNAKVGGAKRSQHVLGNAADIKVKDVSPKEVQEHLKKHFDNDCRGLGRYNSFTHIDVRKGDVARWNG